MSFHQARRLRVQLRGPEPTRIEEVPLERGLLRRAYHPRWLTRWRLFMAVFFPSKVVVDAESLPQLRQQLEVRLSEIEAAERAVQERRPGEQ